LGTGSDVLVEMRAIGRSVNLGVEDGDAGSSGPGRLTRVGQGNLRTRAVTEAGAHGRNDESHDGTDAADDD